MPNIILDRDGVINYESDEYIKSPDEWLPIPGSLAAIAQLNHHGFRVFIATNQSGVARGLFNIETLNLIHAKLIHELASFGGEVADILFCPHHPEDNCLCRKPKPGLLHQIQEKYALPLANTFFIGDSFADVQAALAAPCLPILVLTGKGQKALDDNPNLKKTIPTFPNLVHAVEFILAEEKKNHA